MFIQINDTEYVALKHIVYIQASIGGYVILEGGITKEIDRDYADSVARRIDALTDKLDETLEG